MANKGEGIRDNKTIFTRLRLYTADHQQDWYALVEPLTYAYNTPVHHSTNTSPYLPVLRHPPPKPSLLTAAVEDCVSGN